MGVSWSLGWHGLSFDSTSPSLLLKLVLLVFVHAPAWSCVSQENRTGGVNCGSPLARSYTLEWKNHRDFCRWVGMVSLNWCGWLGKAVCDNFGYPEFLQDHLKIFRNEQLNHVHSFVFMMAMIYLYSRESNTHKKNLGATFMAKILFLSDQ